MSEQPPEETTSLRAEMFVVVLALISVALLVIEIAAELAPEDLRFLQAVDVTIALVFLAEWLLRLWRAPDRKAFAKKWWWELLASIPITNDLAQALRGLRLLRLVRALRILRMIRFAVRLRVLLLHSQRFFGHTHLIAIATTVMGIVLTATIGFHYFEREVNENVRTLWDSFWWAMTTVTTVGYGDIVPVTTGGRLVAIGLMLAGIGTLGAFTATIANWVLRGRGERAAE